MVFDPATTEEKPKYLWDLAVGKGGEVYVAAGAPAVVYRVPAGGGKAEVLFKTADQHIRCLLLGPDGTLWAGSDGSGVIYKFATRGRPGRSRLRCMRRRGGRLRRWRWMRRGMFMRRGWGRRGATALPPLPVTGNVGVSITFVAAGVFDGGGGEYAGAGWVGDLQDCGGWDSAEAADAEGRCGVCAGGAEWELCWRLREIVGGCIGWIRRRPGRFTDVAHLEAAQGMAFAPVKDGLLVATSNSGKVFRLGDAVAKDATYTSEVFDAQGFAQWGRAEVRAGAAAGFDLFVRSGNVESPLMGWSEWVARGSGWERRRCRRDGLCSGRRCCGAAATVDSVALNYLQKNVAPVVDEVVVQPGARVAAGGGASECDDGAGGVSSGCGGSAGGELYAGCECGSADGAEGQDGGDGAVAGA